jgi:hypothetical protein
MIAVLLGLMINYLIILPYRIGRRKADQLSEVIEKVYSQTKTMENVESFLAVLGVLKPRKNKKEQSKKKQGKMKRENMKE